MLETIVITAREGIEAFLIIALSLAFLSKTGRDSLKMAIYAGIVVSIVVSIGVGYWLTTISNTPLVEGSVAMVAAVLIFSLTIQMMRHSHKVKAQIEQGLERNAGKAGTMAFIGVFLFTVLMISREGMELTLMLSAISGKEDAISMIGGTLIGAGTVAVVAYLWAKQSAKINLKHFMQVSGIFLGMFSVYLFLYGFHEITEAFVLPIDNQYWHELTEPMENGLLGYAMSSALILVPTGWLAYSWWKERKPSMTGQIPAA